MVVQFQTSFAPKKTLVAAPTTRASGHSVNIFAIISIAIFVLTVVAATSVYIYRSHLITSIGDMDAQLAAARKSFEPEFIDKASRLSARIDASRTLLGKHTAISPLFDILEKKTLENVRFTEFNFTVSDRTIIASMTGEAKSFNAVALQSDVFGAEPAFIDPVFSNFTLNDEGDVVFNFETKIDPSLLLYREGVVGSKKEPAKEDNLLLDESVETL